MRGVIQPPLRAGQQPALFVCAFLLAVLTLSACHPDNDDLAQIKDNITRMTTAVESSRFGDMAVFLHDDFRANNQMNAQQVKQMLALAGMQQTNVRIRVVSDNTVIDPVYRDKAISTLSVIATSGSGFAGLPADGSARVVTLEWRKDDSWKLLRAHWNE